ncbi:MAG: peptidoglycan-binding domain-containing protein, partial [Ketobacteraceae bacterium]|nr:peptidoglycan-binding domain-containing protein [Ketobacteraceae bacterium]
MITKKHIRFIQSQLARDGFQPGPVDGIYGTKTEAALIQAGVEPDFPKKRKLARYIQGLAELHGIESGKPDGYWGPQTEFAFDQLYEKLELDREPRIWRPEDIEAN